jgi:acyl-CoA thioesterase-1
MNPVVVQIANGNAFFIGMGMTVVAFALHLGVKDRRGVVCLTIGWLFGISLVVLSTAPISYWLYVIWFALCIATRVVSTARISAKIKLLITVAFAVVSLIACMVELSFHFARTIPVSRKEMVYIIGDSISAGIEEKEKTWPNVLGDMSGLKVVNLAKAGATVDAAMDQAVRMSSTNMLVIVEIGGNDLLGSTSSHAFYVQLDKLLAKLKSRNPQIVMFELPLLPFWNNFGRDQRALANKYDVILIPKKYLVSVFAGKGNTVDGLHLSQKGHDELVGMVYNLMRIGP